MKDNLTIKGIFHAVVVDSNVKIDVCNEITEDGIQRILSLIGGQSSEAWSSIRMVSSNPAIFSQKDASTTLAQGKLLSDALFTKADLTFDTETVEMYSGLTKVAQAPLVVAANQTVYITREDVLSYVAGP